MAAQVAPLALAGASTSCASCTGHKSALSLRRCCIAPLARSRGLVLSNCKGGFIPSENRWKYEGAASINFVGLLSPNFNPTRFLFKCLGKCGSEVVATIGIACQDSGFM